MAVLINYNSLSQDDVTTIYRSQDDVTTIYRSQDDYYLQVTG